jgi:hypothetical protein
MSITWWHALPIGVAAVAAFLLGGLWYSPLLFAKAWTAAHGYTPEKLAAMQGKAARAYIASFVGQLVTAGVLHLVLVTMEVTSVSAGMCWGAVLWAGFAAPITLSAIMFSDKKISLFFIDSGYQLAYLLLMGAILGPWH